MSHATGSTATTWTQDATGRIDSLRSVLVSFKVTNGEVGTRERSERISFNVPLPNMGLKNLKICGGEPILGQPLNAAYDNTGGSDKVRLTWNRAYDENSGEKDVVRYVLWRRQLAPVLEPVYGDPLTSIAAGFANYLYIDPTVDAATTYEYRLSAQDCSPKLSTPVTTTATIP